MINKKLQRRIREKGKMTQGKAEETEVTENDILWRCLYGEIDVIV